MSIKKMMLKLFNFTPKKSSPTASEGATSTSSTLHVVELPETSNALDGASIDIILIHGLNGHHLDSFTDQNTGTCWVRDLLPQDLQRSDSDLKGVRVRVLSVSWNSEMRMEDIVSGFVREFGSFRRVTETPIRRPILFIAHSMGGPILQSILVASHATPASSFNDLTITPIKALFFGASETYFKVTESLLSSFTSSDGNEPQHPAGSTTSPLLRDAKFLSEQTRAFNNLIREGYSDIFECQYFLEHSGSEDSKQKPLTDEETQALPGQRRIQLGKGHGPMIRYTSREEPDYKRIVVCVKAAVNRLLE